MTNDEMKISEPMRVKLFNKIKTSDTLVIASIPIIAYVVVFAYDLGYFKAFEVPSSFITFDFYNMVIAILALITILLFFGNFFIPLFQVLNKSEPWIQRKIGPVLIAFTLHFFFVAFYGFSSNLSKYLPIGLVLYFLPSFIYPLFKYKKIKGYKNKLISEENDRKIRKSSEKTNDRTVFSIIYNFLGPEIVLFVFLLFYLYYLGNANGIRQVEFRTLNTDPEKVVLFMNSEIMIASDFDRANKTVDQSFVIIKLGDDPKLQLTFEKVGPLKSIPAKSKHPK